MPGLFLRSRRTAERSVKPARTAAAIGRPRLWSGVKKNIGRMKTKYQTAEIGPVMRASSPVAGSRPKSGGMPIAVLPVSGLADSNATTAISTIMPPR